jgi:hypothetical protein
MRRLVQMIDEELTSARAGALAVASRASIAVGYASESAVSDTVVPGCGKL